MTSSTGAALLGVQEPRVANYPADRDDYDRGLDALDLADIAGRESLPWQCEIVREGMARRADGKWSAPVVGVLASRQNGKNGAIEVVELGWMKTEPGVVILHTAHEFSTALKSMQRLESLIRGIPSLARGMKVRTGNGKESITLANGSTILFRTRTKSGGRGGSVDRLVVDEAMIYSPEAMAALRPLITTGRNPQIWYLGSAADADTHEHCHQWAAVRERGLAGDDRVLWLEWSAPEPTPEQRSDPHEYRAYLDDRANWALANPSLGSFLIDEETIVEELKDFRHKLDKWEVERLSVGKWPRLDDGAERVLDMEAWEAMGNANPALAGGPIALAVDMSADRLWCTIAAATRLTDRRVHLEIGYHERPGPAVVEKIVELVGKFDPCALVLNATSPAMSLLPDLKERGIEPECTSSSQLVQACGGFYDDAVNGQLSHTGDERLTRALDGVRKRDMAGGGFGWDYRSPVNISPLQAATLARWGLLVFGLDEEKPPPPAPALGESADELGADGFDVFSAAF